MSSPTKARTFILSVILLGASFAMVLGARAQEAQVRVAVRGDSAYVYHTADLPLNGGFHVERSLDGGPFERITETPVRALQDPWLLPARLGARYDAIARNLDVSDPHALLLTLRADRTVGLYLTFAYPQVARVMGRLFVDNDAPVGQAVTYRVVFVDGLGQPTGRSLAREVDPLRAAPAPAPDDVALTNRNLDLRIEWTYPPPPDGRGDQVLRFEILRRDPATGTYVLVNSENTLLRNEAQSDFFYLFEAGGVGRTETYVVAAVQISGRRLMSDPVEFFVADNIPPAPVQDVEVYMSDSANVELSWAMSPEPDAAGYHVLRAQSLTDEFRSVNESPLGVLETFYVDNTTSGRRVYYYRIAAVDSSGNRSTLSNAVMARVRDTTPPPAPTAAEAEFQDDGSVRISWEVDAAPDLHTYEVLYRLPHAGHGGAWARANKDAVQGDSYTAQGPVGAGFAEGALYRFGVTAVDSSLNRSDTAFVDLKIPDRTPPEPPESVTARNVGGVRALIRWRRSPSPDVTHYILYRRLDNPSSSDTLLARTGRNGLQAHDENVEAGRGYVYSVSAVDSLGNEGPRSEPVRFDMKDYDAPPAPRGVQAVARPGGGALIAWERAPGEDVAGYRVYRSNIPTGVFDEVTDDILSTTRFTDTLGEAGLYYRIYAIDTSGNTSRPSNPAVAEEPRQ